MQHAVSQPINYYVSNKDLIIKNLSKEKRSLEMKRFSCNQAELEQIELRIKQISNSIKFQEKFCL